MNVLMKSVFGLVCVSLLLLLVHSPLYASDALKSYLVDLKGWEAEPAEAMNMEMNGMKMVSATREYESGSNTVAAAILVTSQQMTGGAFTQMSMSQGGIKIESKKMDGFQIMHTHDSNENSGSFMVLLGESSVNSAMFTVAYEGIAEEDALDIAKKFDWKGMQKDVSDLLK